MTNQNKKPPIIEVRNLVKRFGETAIAVNDVSLDIYEGEFFALLGPSGCGKTTLLRMLAGFENPSEGLISIGGKDMVGVDPSLRPVNMVFQSYAVFPHMTVAQNVGYGLKVTGVAPREIDLRVTEALELVKLEGYGTRLPNQLSGGQQQRVALARALIKRPKVLLLDEPLSALDAKLREQMQLELVRLQKSVGITFVIVTHDQDEALSMADRIAVMSKGRVEQLATPAELYEYPSNRFVADFIGKTNIFSATVVGRDGESLLVDVPQLGRMALPFEGDAQGEISLAIRPEKLRLEAHVASGDKVSVKGKVQQLAYYGGESHVHLDCASGMSLSVTRPNGHRGSYQDVIVGEEAFICWDSADMLVLTH
ncbi:MAG: ABC transporter ATP-binding protein [Rhodobacter sp.]|jgi:spermidine/putrescine ABC transporter ATP-binding subunit|nr:MAG: spermidine/putrescine ABC transporter ATP-binding protein [Rhodobacter sp. BACL10 MAG-120910-bin24]